MEKVQIRRVTPAEIESLLEIGRQTFFETFAAVNTEENMKKYLDAGFSREKMTAELADPQTDFYFAVAGRKIIGYLKLNTGSAQTEIQDDRAMEIERIYVLKEYFGKNVGQLLYEKAIQTAKAAGASYVWLGVWENNLRAIAFYRKNGFVPFDTHIFRLGDEEQTDIMMKLELEDGRQY